MAPGFGWRRGRQTPQVTAAAVLLLALTASAGLPTADAAGRDTKGADITLQAKWQGTALLHEAAEFLADEDPALFWRFVEEWKQRSAGLGASPSKEQCWAGIKDTAATHLSPIMARLFAVSLAARQYSPKLEMYRQLAGESRSGGIGMEACCWALLGGTAYTEAARLEAALVAALEAKAAQLREGSAQQEVTGGAGAVYPFDHIYAAPASLAPPLNITSPAAIPVELYAPIGSRCGTQLHSVLAAAVERADAAATAAAAAGTAANAVPRLAYAWRPLLEESACGAAAVEGASTGGEAHPCTMLGTEGRVVLPGYGVELALKNMEYNAQDDSKKTSEVGKAGEEEGEEDVAAAAAGQEDADQEVEESDGVLQLKLKALGLQAAQRMLNAAANSSAGQDPLAALQEVAQDFPRLVRQLSQQKYGRSLRTAVEGLQRYIHAGAQFLLLNGLTYDLHDFTLYAFLDTLRREVRLHDALSDAGLPPGQIREAMMLRGAAAGSEEPPRLRLVGDGIAWVNDLERDPQYARWPRDLQTLLMPVYPGRLPRIARNVLNGIFAFDPASPAALDIGALMHQLEQQKWPVRLGYLPVVAARVARARGSAAPSAGELPSLSERMGRLLAAIHTTFGGRAAAHFLYAVRQFMPPEAEGQSDFGNRLWVQAKRIVEEQWFAWGAEMEDEPSVSAAEVIQQAEAAGEAGNKDVARMLQTAAELAHSTGLAGPSRSGVLVFNGVVSTNDGGGGWQGVTMGAVQAQMQGVQEDVYMQRLTDTGRDLYAELLELHGSIPRYNPRILPLDAAAGYVRISGETDEYPARQLALTGPLLHLNATSTSDSDPYSSSGLRVRYFGPQPSLLADLAEGEGEASPGGSFPLAAVTHWVVADVGTRQGLRLVAAGLQHRSSSGRLAVVVNSASAAAAAAAAAATAAGEDIAGPVLPIEQVVVAVGSGLLGTDLNDFVDGLDGALQLKEPPSALTLAQLDELLQFEGRLEGALRALGPRLGAAAASQARFARQALGLGPGVCAVVTNGRLIELPPAPELGTLNSAEGGSSFQISSPAPSTTSATEFEPHDFELLELYAQRNQYSDRVADLVQAASQANALGGSDPSTVAAVVSSALAAAKPDEVDTRSGRIVELIAMQSKQKNFLNLPSASAASVPSDTHPAPLLIQAVLNPLSKAAQRLAPLLSFLRAVLEVDVQLLLNPQREYEDMPLKTFYRYVLPPLGDQGDGSSLPAPAAARFSGLPPDKVLTLGMDEPEPWLVEPVAAEHDLDNLRLEELGPGQPAIHAVFEVEALMLTGMCLDLASLAARLREQIHPRGVQLQLLPLSAPADAPPLVDTLVMSNLGYFQLKAGPGLWKLKLAPGRSQELYTVASSTGATSSGQRAEAAVAGADAHQVPVALSSFDGKHMHLFLRKHPHMLEEDVLQEGDGTSSDSSEGNGGGSLWNKVASWAGGPGPGAERGGGAVAADGTERETIHIFTVASGHMYERLQKIMVLSAVKRTPARLKFWFIKNYMSPQMKAFVPFMAEKYDFDYEFVTYKWPSWLHKQSEKQRIIWAYKILFLDVLFPLGLKKVIFCDSDQVVRADLRQLWHMDLQGAPYGYTPFCDNNREMEGFRFWKQGFWKDHLQGRPYHISALYVVDLERFRQMAAGDRLRVIYDGLSKDPNSLANLDQDLPNYAQHGVPIFSLPNEWLWCETWCGSETRPQAKTIDLCNNPLTKEPKLQSARRIIAEWPDLDREAQEFTAAVERVQHGEMSREALMADNSLFHVRLTPMVEGSTWTSESPAHTLAFTPTQDSGSGSGGSGAADEGQDGAHDATEL